MILGGHLCLRGMICFKGMNVFRACMAKDEHMEIHACIVFETHVVVFFSCERVSWVKRSNHDICFVCLGSWSQKHHFYFCQRDCSLAAPASCWTCGSCCRRAKVRPPQLLAQSPNQMLFRVHCHDRTFGLDWWKFRCLISFCIIHYSENYMPVHIYMYVCVCVFHTLILWCFFFSIA